MSAPAIAAVPASPPSLVPVWSSQRVWNGVTLDARGQAFASFPSCDGRGVQLVKLLADNGQQPYPDAAWNRLDDRHDPAGRFVNVNAMRVGPDGLLWVIDAGAPGLGEAAIPGGARLVVIDTASDRIVQVHDLAAGVKPMSYIDDIRFSADARKVYLTDAGAPALLVLDLASGAVVRRLEDQPCTTDQRTMKADGKPLLTQDGSELRVHADQIEVSPDGRWCYFQPSSGPTYRVATADLENLDLPEDQLATRVDLFWDGPTTGGTAIDAQGRIYYSDVETRRILRIDAQGDATVLIEDERLIWSDAMWIDAEGWLWLPATQQNRTPGFAGGAMSVEYPVWIYKYFIGVGPSPIDHA